jgi:hypothetical protein
MLLSVRLLLPSAFTFVVIAADASTAAGIIKMIVWTVRLFLLAPNCFYFLYTGI